MLEIGLACYRIANMDKENATEPDDPGMRSDRCEK